MLLILSPQQELVAVQVAVQGAPCPRKSEYNGAKGASLLRLLLLLLLELGLERGREVAERGRRGGVVGFRGAGALRRAAVLLGLALLLAALGLLGEDLAHGARLVELGRGRVDAEAVVAVEEALEAVVARVERE